MMTMTNEDTPYIDLINEAREKYFYWLYDFVKLSEWKPGKTYYILARLLHDKEFYWTVDNDGNRADDGKKLRELWLDSIGNPDQYPLDSLNGPCSVFEMMIGMAYRAEEAIMYDIDEGDRTHLWFRDIIRNLGFEAYTDDVIDLDISEKINFTIQNALDRTYDENGNGGFWPLRFSTKDQRKVELWYQMNCFLDENYILFYY